MHPKNCPDSKVAIVLCPKWFKLLLKHPSVIKVNYKAASKGTPLK